MTSRTWGSNSKNNLNELLEMTFFCSSSRSKVARAQSPPYTATLLGDIMSGKSQWSKFACKKHFAACLYFFPAKSAKPAAQRSFVAMLSPLSFVVAPAVPVYKKNYEKFSFHFTKPNRLVFVSTHFANLHCIRSVLSLRHKVQHMSPILEINGHLKKKIQHSDFQQQKSVFYSR